MSGDPNAGTGTTSTTSSSSGVGVMLSPVLRQRKRLASMSRASTAMKTMREAGFTRGADDKIYSERLQDLAGFVPSFMVAEVVGARHPSVEQALREESLPCRVAADGVNTSRSGHLLSSDVVAWHQESSKARGYGGGGVRALTTTYPPERWTVQEHDEVERKEERRSGEGERLGSRGLWQKRRPPVRYHARGRIGRGDRLWIDRSACVEVQEDEEVRQTGVGACAEALLFQRHGGRSGRATGNRESRNERETTKNVVERRYAYGMFHSRTAEARSRGGSGEAEVVGVGTIDGARRHLYATPHPLESGQKFYDVGRTMNEQVPLVTTTLKHLLPSVFMACEEIATNQPIVSAASSAAGTAKSKSYFFCISRFFFFSLFFL